MGYRKCLILNFEVIKAINLFYIIMIQRPQSVLLVIIAISMLAMLHGDLWVQSSLINGEVLHTICAWSLKAPGKEAIYAPYIFVMICISGIICLAFYALAKHNDRKFQLRILTSSLAILFFVIILIYSFAFKQMQGVDPSIITQQFNPKCFLLLVAFISMFLCYLLISKDEKLVKDDSLR